MDMILYILNSFGLLDVIRTVIGALIVITLVMAFVNRK